MVCLPNFEPFSLFFPSFSPWSLFRPFEQYRETFFVCRFLFILFWSVWLGWRPHVIFISLVTVTVENKLPIAMQKAARHSLKGGGEWREFSLCGEGKGTDSWGIDWKIRSFHILRTHNCSFFVCVELAYKLMEFCNFFFFTLLLLNESNYVMHVKNETCTRWAG